MNALEQRDQENRGIDPEDSSTDVEQFHDAARNGCDEYADVESLKRPFDPGAPRFIEYPDHADRYGATLNPHESDD